MTVKKLDSNQSNLSVAEEATLRHLPGTDDADSVWYPYQPNSYTDFGGDTKTVERAPLNASRQNFRSVVVGQDASGGFNTDFLNKDLFRIMQGFMFADAHEKPDTKPVNGAASVTINDVTALQYEATTGLAGFHAGALVWASGFGVAANNGLKPVTASGADHIACADLAVEASPPAGARLEVVGVRGAAGDLTLTVDASHATVGSTALDFTTLGLNVGEWVFIGGDNAANKFFQAANQGYGRVASIATNALALDETTFAAVNDAGTAKQVDIYFGKFLRNEFDPTLIKRRSYNLERTLGNNGTGVQAEYLEGAVCDEIDFNFPLEAKATADLKFVACAHTKRTGAEGVKAGTRVAANYQAKTYNTSTDIYRSQIAPSYAGSLNAGGLFGYANDAKLTIKNSVAPTKAIASGLYAIDTVAGNFVGGGSLTCYFTDVASIDAISNNTDCEYNAIMAANNQGCVFDMPMLGLGNGKLDVTKDKEITIPVDLMASINANGYTMSLTQFGYLPAAAMPKFV
jgi:hypothetical protein